MTRTPILSVIIGIRDWEVARLRVAIRSHTTCTIGEELEVVISDYGSENHAQIKELASELGCTYVYTEATLWSRSRALNAGIVASRGEYILATDADIIFAPDTHAITVDYLRKFPRSLQLKQCRDLPESVTLEDLQDVNWSYLNSIARTRPRWGMGGLAACRRDLADEIRGYDERMVVWGAEDNDFGKRLRASGAILNWMTDNSAQIYHVWHPPFLQTHPKAQEIFNQNKKYLNEDQSIIRNLDSDSIYRPLKPLVSVVIATKNRAKYLKAAIESVLNQSFRDFELIVIDDGSDDHTQDVLREFSDSRVKTIYNEKSLGVAGARNKANATARGKYIAVHDDDDLMLPWRLEQQLGSIKSGVSGSYGGWIDFDNESNRGRFHPGKQPFGLASICFSGGVLLHPTLLAEKKVFERFPYHKNFLAGSDYNVAFRMAWNLVDLSHCGSYVTLRRIHSANMTSVSASNQKVSSHVTTSVFLNAIGAAREQACRKEALSVSEVTIDLPVERFRELLNLVPLNGFHEVIDLPPNSIDSYDTHDEFLLIGRIADGDIVLHLEQRSCSGYLQTDNFLSQELGERIQRPGVRRIVSFGDKALQREDDDVSVSESYGGLVAGALSRGNNWIVLHTNQSGRISELLKKIEHLLPPLEDIIFISQKGTWIVALENQPYLRGAVLSRKLEISNLNFEIHSVKAGAQ